MSDVRFTASKETSREACSSPETTYDEVKIMKTPSEAPSAAGTTGSEAAGGRSKVTEGALLLVLCALLVAAAVGLCLVSFDNLQMSRKLDECQVSLDNSTVVNSSILVKPTCLNESQLQTCMNENEALRKNLTAEPCPTDWDQHGGSCYYFSSSKLTWDQSRSECKDQGADLVQIDSEEEQTFLENRLRGKVNGYDDRFWIGLTDAKEEGRWFWVDGSPLNTSLSFWYGKEPDNWKVENPAGENCARMGMIGGVKDLKCWWDKSCDATQRRICEKAAKTGR